MVTPQVFDNKWRPIFLKALLYFIILDQQTFTFFGFLRDLLNKKHFPHFLSPSIFSRNFQLHLKKMLFECKFLVFFNFFPSTSIQKLMWGKMTTAIMWRIDTKVVFALWKCGYKNVNYADIYGNNLVLKFFYSNFHVVNP